MMTSGGLAWFLDAEALVKLPLHLFLLTNQACVVRSKIIVCPSVVLCVALSCDALWTVGLPPLF